MLLFPLTLASYLSLWVPAWDRASPAACFFRLGGPFAEESTNGPDQV